MAEPRDRPPDGAVAPPAPPQPVAWRRSISSPRGFATITGLALALVLVALLIAGQTVRIVRAPDPLLGQPVGYPSASHVQIGALGPNPALTPAGGHHYRGTVAPGIYSDPVPDGNAIHSLEHGIVWITYQPDQISDADLDTLEDIAADFDHDTILSPRLENSFPVIIVSWERRLTQTHLHQQALRDFVSTNRNRSPEPGVR